MALVENEEVGNVPDRRDTDRPNDPRQDELYRLYCILLCFLSVSHTHFFLALFDHLFFSVRLPLLFLSLHLSISFDGFLDLFLSVSTSFNLPF